MKRTITLASVLLTLALASFGVAGLAWSAPAGVGFDIPLRGSTADAEESARGINLAGHDLELGADGTTAQTVGLQFSDVSVPQGATITRAYVQFQADEVGTAPTQLTIAGQAADISAAFTTASRNVSGRALTTARVAWAPAPWTTVGAHGADQRTPDLSAVLQEIVSRSGWSTGNALTLLVAGSGTRTAEAYDGGAAKAPVLHIETGPATSSSTSAPAPAAVQQPVTQEAAPSTATSAPATGAAPTATTSTTSTTTATTAAAQKATTGSASTAVTAAATSVSGACAGSGRTVARTVPAGTTLTSQWAVKAPPNDATYDLTGVTSTAYPATKAPFAVGTSATGARTCLVGGTIRGKVDPSKTWEYYHDQANASCVMIAATDWMRVQGLRCDGVEDGIKPKESSTNANNSQILVSGTYLSNIRDDCMENDYTVGGVLSDNLWESCNTGISERPSKANGSWSTPSSETLTLDHMLIGLQKTLHATGGMGENTLFKWSSSANRLVIKCSTFKVDAVSLNGKSAMAFPAGTVIDDSQCAGNPTTIVWLGGGSYPGSIPSGVRVVNSASTWTSAVSSWKAAHGF